MLKASDLKDRAVLSLDEAAKVGTVHDVIFDLAQSIVAGFVVQTGHWGGARLLLAGDVQNIGADAVTIRNRNVLAAHPSATTQGLPPLSDLLGAKVVSQEGALVGTLGDVELDTGGFRISNYVLSGNLWDQLRHAEKCFAPVAGIRFGDHLLIIPESLAAELGGRGTTPAGSPDQSAR